ncbi:MAG: hypothetical protein IH988_03650 [Planctomycetes bacterium]|nr:hypothetical protein [Planctomycetota bacterium]
MGRYQQLLVMAAAAAFLEICADRRLWQAGTTPIGVAGLALIVIGGFWVALGLREIALEALPDDPGPWFTRKGALLLLAGALITINSIVWLALHVVGTPQNGLVAGPLLWLASELFWIVWLDRPGRDGASKDVQPVPLKRSVARPPNGSCQAESPTEHGDSKA